MRGSSASVTGLVGLAKTSPLPEMETLSPTKPSETVTSIIVDEPPVPPAYDIPHDEL